MEITTYRLIDNQTKKIITESTDRKRLQRRRDKLDLAYGAVRYSVQPVYAV